MIPLQETYFNFDGIRDRIIGAGILPVALHPERGACFLLGKERYINHWRGSLKWSGFEGGRKSEEEIECTAAREFIEESLGTVRLNGEDPEIENVADMLRRGDYVARIVLCILHGEDADRRYHVTYVVEIPYDDSYGERFSTRRRTLFDLQTKVQHLSRLFDSIVTTRLPCEGSMYDGIFIVAVTRVECLHPHLMRVEFEDDHGASHVREIDDVCDEDGAAYARWFRTRQACSMDIDKIDYCKDAIVVERDANNLVISARVNEDYIEKQSVRWWTVSELKAVLGNGGYMHTEFFRAYFLPVLQRAIGEMPA
tara:strand:+ start:432 stop:1364 length:933 start_codon:yes stop_codon:yes gene_type:complete